MNMDIFFLSKPETKKITIKFNFSSQEKIYSKQTIKFGTNMAQDQQSSDRRFMEKVQQYPCKCQFLGEI